jgi:hypothetical protein
MEGVWYMDMPVSNVIRSTGIPGIIHITVSASGLASGSFEILAEELNPDNSVIAEPVLDDEGRKPVDRMMIIVDRLNEVPREIKPGFDEINLSASDKHGFEIGIRDYIIKSNTALDTSTIEFRTLIDLFAAHLLHNNGKLIADDYNFNADHYNNCRLISGYITSTKLPQLFKEGLREYYAESIIRQGSEKNAGDEMNWLNWIPSGGLVVIYQEDSAGAGLSGGRVTDRNELNDLITLVHPGYPDFSSEAKERAMIFISKMNPYIKISALSEQSREGNKEMVTNVSYIAEEGQPILIPELKFIAE